MVSALSRTGNGVVMYHVYIMAIAQTCVCTVAMCRHVGSVGTVWTCVFTVATVWTHFAGFFFSLHLHVWFDIPASISTKQPIIHQHFAMGFCVAAPVYLQF